MKSKKGQLVGQIFILILAAFIFILILLYGYRAISSLGERGEQVALADFETTLRGSVNDLRLSFGSVRRLDVTLPSGYDQVCFFCSRDEISNNDPYCRSAEPNPSTATDWGKFQNDKPLLVELWEGGSQNVFFQPLAETEILIEGMKVENTAECIDVRNSRISLRLEGLGDSTLVGEWEDS